MPSMKSTFSLSVLILIVVSITVNDTKYPSFERNGKYSKLKLCKAFYQ